MSFNTVFMVVVLWAGLFSLNGVAGVCFEPSPAKKENRLYDPVSSDVLSDKQRLLLARLLKKLNHDRDGYSEGFFCKQGLGKVADSYSTAIFRAQELDDGRFDFRIQFQDDRHVISEERLRYTLSGHKLLLGPNERGNDIIIKALGGTELITYEKYRQRSPRGVSIVRETVRHYQFKRGLRVKNTYYINGALQSENRWWLD